MRLARQSRRQLHQALSIALIALSPFLLAGVARYAHLLEVVELKTLDGRQRVADALAPPSTADVMLVTIDAQTEDLLGSHLFWSPSDYQPLISVLQQADPSAILLVIWLRREWPEDRATLPGESLMVIRPYKTSSQWHQKGLLRIAQWDPVIANLREAEVQSFSYFPLDPADGIYRTAQCIVLSSDASQYHLSLELHAALKYWGLRSAEMQLHHNPWLGWRLQSTSAETPRQIPLDSRGRLWLRYAGKPDRFSTMSVMDTLGRYQEGPDRFREKLVGKVVLIGVASASDQPVLTPVGRLNALSRRANAVNTLLRQDFITRWTQLADLTYLLACAILVVMVALIGHMRAKGTVWVLGWNALILGVHLAWVLFSFVMWRWWVDLTAPTLAITTGAGISALFLGYLRISSLFGELRSTQHQLIRSEKEAAYGAMAAQVRHELKNILNSIRSPAEMVRNNFERGDPLQLGENPDEIVTEMNVIIDRVTKLNEMIENELSFFQNSNFRFDSVALDGIIQDSLSMAEQFVKHSQVEVRQDIAPKLWIEADSDKVKIALLNLFRNACEAMPHGGVLEIRAGEQLGQCVVQVRDTGRGIAEADIDRIFEPFVTTKARGLGLGLANVRNIIEGHGGVVEVSSGPNTGTTFVLHIPLKHSPRSS